MNVSLLKLRFLFFLSLLLSLGVQAQNPRFIYIQAENKQPFYVKIDRKILSSSATGYIIIPRLTEKDYQLTIGFSQNEWPEFNVTVQVKDSDIGLLLRMTENKSWGVTNLRTNESLASSKEQVEVVSEGDEFARILAQVVNDPSIAQVTVVKKMKAEEKVVQAEVDKKIVKTDNVKTATPEIIKEEIKPVEVQPDVKKDAVIDKAEISKLKEESSSAGLLITYLDVVNAATDTIKVFMPVIKTEAVIEEAAIEKEKQPEIPQAVVKKDEAGKRDSRFIDMELQNPNAKKDTAAPVKDDFVITEKKSEINTTTVTESKTETAASDTKKVMINSDCKKIASQDDFLELRKNMAAETSEKAMQKTASKQFVKTCFTAEQVKNLGVLFISEEERYKFFVAAFPFVSDTHNFDALEDQLTGEYYKKRFKAMLGH